MIERLNVNGRAIEVSIVSIGNRHAVQVEPDVVSAPVTAQGPAIETYPRFPDRGNAGYMQVLDRHDIAPASGRRCRRKRSPAAPAQQRWSPAFRATCSIRPCTARSGGGTLTIAWPGGDNAVVMKGPAVTVFEGTLELEE